MNRVRDSSSMAMNTMASQDTPGMTVYRAPSLFQPHRARQALRDAHNGDIPPLLGLYLGLSTVQTARFVAPMGFDIVWVDWEHSSCNVETMTTMVHELIFMSEGRTMPFVRVPGHDHAAIGFALDCGASIVVPQVDTVEQAKHVVSAAKYGSKSSGTRSAPPFRLIPGLTNVPVDSRSTLHENLNQQAAIIIQIESAEGVRNLDSILTEVPEIDAVWLGAFDLRISMDLDASVGVGGGEPEWLKIVALYDETLKKHNKPKSGFCFGDEDQLKERASDMSFICIESDTTMLMKLMSRLGNARDAVKRG